MNTIDSIYFINEYEKVVYRRVSTPRQRKPKMKKAMWEVNGLSTEVREQPQQASEQSPEHSPQFGYGQGTWTHSKRQAKETHRASTGGLQAKVPRV
ncbi:unnamed protein product [[Candida] boidinii]|nr:unnamed protein product [[Candida] boidinii]